MEDGVETKCEIYLLSKYILSIHIYVYAGRLYNWMIEFRCDEITNN